MKNVPIINDEEIIVVGHLLGIDAIVENFLQIIVDRYNLKPGILSKGRQESTLICSDKVSTFSRFDLLVRDSVGAGDSFTHAIALAMLCNYDLDHLNECANKISPYVCKTVGALPGIPKYIS